MKGTPKHVWCAGQGRSETWGEGCTGMERGQAPQPMPAPAAKRLRNPLYMRRRKPCGLPISFSYRCLAARDFVTPGVGRLGHAAAVGAATVAISQGTKIGTQILSVAILARLLTPADFGTVALVAPLSAFVVIFQDFGLQQAIVQRRDVSQQHLTPAFWFTAWLGLACAAIMVAGAPGIAAFFGDERLIALTI